MKRRTLIASSASILLGGSVNVGSSKGSVAANFEIDSPSLNPSDVETLLVDLKNFRITPRYIDQKTELNIELKATLEDSKYSNNVSKSVEIENGNEYNLSDTTVGRIVIDNINEDQLSISGEVQINISGSEFRESYNRGFTISGENIPDGAVGVEDWYDFDEIRDNLSGDYVQLNNLDSQSPGYDEVASNSANGGLGFRPLSNIDSQFKGSYDGKGYKIEDLYLEEDSSNSSRGRVGIFGTVGSGGVVEKLVINNTEVIKTTEENDGGIVAASLQSGTVRDCYVNANLQYNGPSGKSFHYGLIVGNCNGTVKRCSTEGSVYADNQGGGIVGNTSTKASFVDCRTTATVDGSGTRRHSFHGDNNIPDESKLEFTRCFSTGTGQDSKFSNGQGVYTDCYHDTSSSGHSSNVSGVTNLTTSEMQGSSASSNMIGFDYTNVWEKVDGKYPILRTIPRDIQT